MYERASTLNSDFRDVFMAPGDRIDITHPIMDPSQTREALGVRNYSWTTSFETAPALNLDPVSRFLRPSETFHVLQATPDRPQAVPRPTHAHNAHPRDWPISDPLNPGDIAVLRQSDLEIVRALGMVTDLDDYRELYYRTVSQIQLKTVAAGSGNLVIGRASAFGESLHRHTRISGIHAELAVAEDGVVTLTNHGQHSTLATYNPANKSD